MTNNNHTEEVSKEATVRAGKRITYRGKELDLRELKFALYCRQGGFNPWDGIPPTSKKGGAS